jgi:alpha-amylase
MPPTTLRFKFLAALALLSALSLGFVAQPSSSSAVESATISKPITNASVGIQMFGWSWPALEAECKNTIGPNGIDWILTLPPQDHITGSAWWTHYQPTSYSLNSSAGNSSEFASMVSVCNTAGVKVITDAVLNHMAGGSGVSFDGKSYEFGTYQNLFKPNDFHFGLPTSDPHYCADDISNWDAFRERTDCQFPGLPDLATEKPEVRQKIADFLNSQLELGVSGFRLDAAKHMPPADIAAIKSLLIRDAYIVQEVPGSTSLSNEYIDTGDVWAWETYRVASSMFGSPGGASLGVAFDFDTRSYPESAKSLSWVSNHDTEHHGGAVTYGSGKLYEMAFAWLLAEPYGKPMLYSGYAFSDDNDDAPRGRDGKILAAKCASSSSVKFDLKFPQFGSYKAGQFTCLQRWNSVAGMISFRDASANEPKTNKFAKKGVLAFGRNSAGYVLFNSNLKAHSALKMATGMAPGTYCDLYSGGKSPIKIAGKSCKGTSVIISKGGLFSGKVSPLTAIAITKESRLK